MNKTLESVKDIITKEEVRTAIESIATNLGIAAEHVYGVLVKQAYVEAWTSIFAIVVAIFMSLVLWLVANRVHRKENLDFAVGFYVVACIATIVSLIILSVNIETITTGFINPEYKAIQDILRMVK